SGDSRPDECGTPAPGGGDEWDGSRREDRADIRARVEERSRVRSLLLREPERDRLDRRREIPPFAEPERHARGAEAEDAPDQRVPYRGDAPGGDRDRVPDARAE